jgi:chemotaxis protein MotB
VSRRKPKSSEGASQNSMGWLTTFNDLVTNLMVFFVLLFAMSNIDTRKMKDFQYALQSGLGVLEAGDQVSVAVENSRLVPDMSHIETQAEGPQESQASELRRQVLEQVQEMVAPDFGLKFSESNEGIHLTFTDAVLFAAGSAEIQPQGQPLLHEIGRVIRQMPYDVRVEGHTDNLPIRTRRFPSNWELSTARAVNVVKHLIESEHIEPRRLSAVGYGDSKPLVPNDDAEHRAQNRRVEIVLMTEGQKDNVK